MRSPVYPDDLKFANAARRCDLLSALPVKELVKNVGRRRQAARLCRQYGLCRRAGRAAGHRIWTRSRAALSLPLQGQSQADRPELRRGAGGRRAGCATTCPSRTPTASSAWTRPTGKILIDGNTAAALGAIFGGVSVGRLVSDHPVDQPGRRARRVPAAAAPRPGDRRGRPTRSCRPRMSWRRSAWSSGAGWAGARAMTATSGPGISLMTEFAGMGYFAEIPGVIWDIMRMGPSTGLPTRVSQGDVLKAYYLGHGDTRHVCLLPGSMQECFEFGYAGLRPGRAPADAGVRAERPRPGHEPVDDRAVRLSRAADGPRQGARPPRSIKAARRAGAATRIWTATASPIARCPATSTRCAAYFTRGTGHNERAVYSERPDDWENNLIRLFRKHDTARTLVPKPVVDRGRGRADRHHRLRLDRPGHAGGARPPARSGRRDQLPARCARCRCEETLREFVGAIRARLCRGAELRRPDAPAGPAACAGARRARSAASPICDGLPLTARFVTEAILEKER